MLLSQLVMQPKHKSKLFKRGKDKEKTSLMINKPILDALKMLSEESGDSVSDIVCEFLDEYLTALVNAGELLAPVEVRAPISQKVDEAG